MSTPILTFRYAGPAFGGPRELRFGPGGPAGPNSITTATTTTFAAQRGFMASPAGTVVPLVFSSSGFNLLAAFDPETFAISQYTVSPKITGFTPTDLVGVLYGDGSSVFARPRRFGFMAKAAGTESLPWVAGVWTLASLTLCTLTGSTSDVTVSLNGTPVAGWENLSASTTPGSHAPDSPVALSTGDVLAVTWSGSATNLSFGFSE